jgi:hypothetical protein
MIYPNRATIVKIFCIGCLLLGCSSERDVETPTFTEYSVKNTQAFLSLENTLFLGSPTSIEAVSGGLLIVDKGHFQITKVDYEGNRLLSFGKRGRGPGEFQSISGFWPFENEYLVYDYNSFKFSTFDHSGNLIDEEILEENPVNSSTGRSIPITLDAISSNKILIPTGGLQGSLFAIADLINGDAIYTGNAVVEYIEYNHQDNMQTFSKGEIPDIHRNMVMLNSSSSAIYSFQQTTGVLEKYTHAGEQVWEKKLDIPAQSDLFDQISEHNRELGLDDFPRMFLYGRGMDALEEGVALLLNLPDDQPLTIAWVPEDGSKIDLVEVEGITLDGNSFRDGFTISPDGQHAYYLKRSKGTIYQFEWPL